MEKEPQEGSVFEPRIRVPAFWGDGTGQIASIIEEEIGQIASEFGKMGERRCGGEVVSSLLDSAWVLRDWRRTISLWGGEKGGHSASLGNGWEVHTVGRLGSEGDGRSGMVPVFITKNGKLNDSPAGKPAYRIYGRVIGKDAEIPGGKPGSVNIIEQGYFQHGKAWSPDRETAAFFQITYGVMRQVWLRDGSPYREGGKPTHELFARPDLRDPMELWKESHCFRTEWVDANWEVQKSTQLRLGGTKLPSPKTVKKPARPDRDVRF